MAINILVIDDDARGVRYMMDNLIHADVAGIIGSIVVDDGVTKVETLEKFDVGKYGTKFNVALIDYQLTCSFTGILVSAWISLYLKIPRLTLSTAAYPGDPDYFNGQILKNEITDDPNSVIQRIKECVEGYDAEVWLNWQHRDLVLQYQKMLEEVDPDSKPEFTAIQKLLDHFEKILDTRQEERIKCSLIYEQSTSEYVKMREKNEKQMLELNEKLNHYLEEMKK
jgi:hypothetical protein